jgi:hypothetical protein
LRRILRSLMSQLPEPRLGASLRALIKGCRGLARAAVYALWPLIMLVAMPLSSSACAPLSDATRPAQAPDMTSGAKALFEQGVEKYEKGDLAGALVAFRESHKLTPQAGTLWNIAVIELKQGLGLAAHTHLREYLHRWPGAKHEAEAEQQIAALEQKLTRLVVVNAPASATLTIDGQRYPIDAWLWPGTYNVLLEAPGRIAEQKNITLDAGKQHRLRFDLAMAPPPDRTKDAFGYGLFALGHVFLGIGANYFLISADKKRSLIPSPESDCDSKCAEAKSYADRAMDLGIAGAAIVATGILVVVIPRLSKTSKSTLLSLSPNGIVW